MAFTRVAAAGEIQEGEMRKFDIGELEITVANVRGNLHAFEDRCPHMNSPLHQGKLEGTEVQCPFHKARFDVTTGKKVGDPRVPIPKVIKMGALMSNIRTHDLVLHAVKVEDGSIYIDL